MVQVKIVKALYEFIEVLATYAYKTFRKTLGKAQAANTKKLVQEQNNFSSSIQEDKARFEKRIADEKKRHNERVDKLAQDHGKKLAKLGKVSEELSKLNV